MGLKFVALTRTYYCCWLVLSFSVLVSPFVLYLCCNLAHSHSFYYYLSYAYLSAILPPLPPPLLCSPSPPLPSPLPSFLPSPLSTSPAFLSLTPCPPSSPSLSLSSPLSPSLSSPSPDEHTLWRSSTPKSRRQTTLMLPSLLLCRSTSLSPQVQDLGQHTGHVNTTVFFDIYTSSLTSQLEGKWRLVKKNREPAPELITYALTQCFSCASHQAPS